MDVVFVTHNDLGLACLEELQDMGAAIQAIYTRPDRDDIADQVPVGEFGTAHEIPVHTIESVNDDAVRDQIAAYEPDLLFVVGWSQLVEPAVLDLASVAALGMHPAPLPRGRGRAPLAWSIIKELDETALSLFHLVEAADAGDLVGQHPIPIDIGDDAASLYEKMVEAGRDLVREAYPKFEAGEVPRQPQDESQATWWPKREPHHGLIDWTHSPRAVYNWIRGQTHPYPGAFSYLDGQKVTVWAAEPPQGETAFANPGEIVERSGDMLSVSAWEGTLELTRVQVADGPELPASELLDRYDFSVGDVFENARDRR